MLRLAPTFWLTTAGLALTVGSVVKITSAQSRDEQAVRAVVQAYFDGRARSDTALLGSAFLLPQATMYAWRDTALLELPIPAWLQRIAANPRTGPRDPRETDEVLAIDIDHTVAHAKVRTVTADRVITDHMNLVKVRGRWVIVSKIFESVPKGS
jgi:hypothetical protein